MKICIVDDEKIILDMYGEKLSALGYQVFKYTSPREALEAIPKDTPDLILLDIIMPELDGFDLMKKIRKINGCEKIPIIFLTNLDDGDSREKAVKLGALYYINKSEYLPKDLSKLVQEVLTVKKTTDKIS